MPMMVETLTEIHKRHIKEGPPVVHNGQYFYPHGALRNEFGFAEPPEGPAGIPLKHQYWKTRVRIEVEAFNLRRAELISAATFFGGGGGPLPSQSEIDDLVRGKERIEDCCHRYAEIKAQFEALPEQAALRGQQEVIQKRQQVAQECIAKLMAITNDGEAE